MSFWREPLAWRVGPVDAWESTLGSYDRHRTWPVRFRDWDSFKSFCSMAEDYLGNLYISGARDVDEFYNRPGPANTEVRISVGDGTDEGGSFGVHMTTAPHWEQHSPNVLKYVTMTCKPPAQHNPAGISMDALVKAFDLYTVPLTRRERKRNAPVVTKRTEAEFYADEQARKVRRSAWVGSAVISVLGGFAGAWLKTAIGL